MWMTDYIRAIKCQFRDTYGFVPPGARRTIPPSRPSRTASTR